MLPIYLVIGLLQIFAQHKNYNIHPKDPDMDIRVRRSLDKSAGHTVNDIIFRDKRQVQYHITVPRYNRNDTKNHQNPFNILNSTWTYLFNSTKNLFNHGNVTKRNGTVNNGKYTVYNKTVIRSYPYGYPTSYINKNTGYTTQKNNETPYYNYQYPDGKNFGGYYYGLNMTKAGYNQSGPLNSSNNNRWAPWTSNNTGINLAPYPPGYADKKNINNTIPYSYQIPYYPGNNGSLPVYNVTAEYNSTTTTETTLTGCVICRVPCPAFFRRFGNYCVQNKDDEE